MERKRTPVILDGDPGHDDAIMITMANGSSLFDIKLLSSVNGNQTIEKTTLNMLKIANLLSIDAPVAKGAIRPMKSPVIPAGNWHGKSGLDGYRLSKGDKKIADKPSYEMMYDILSKSDEQVIIIATGPLTNLGILLSVHPDIKDKIKLISIWDL